MNYLSAPESKIASNRLLLRSSSVLMQDIYDKTMTVARLEKHVLLIGEMGVGKKHVARIIHNEGARKSGPFMSFYCVDVDEAQLKDAFCEHVFIEGNHINLKYDLLEKASHGVLFIDQFGELDVSMMYSVLDSYRIGCHQLFRYNTSAAPRLVISISQSSYKRLIGTEVWDYVLQTLNPISIMLPPLRERKEDIFDLVHDFISQISQSEDDWSQLTISDEAMNKCMAYSWPGNIRQLKNALMQGAVLSCGETIQSHHLPFSMNWKLPYRQDSE
ncbi:MAG: sigma 54-interacting transcriptional regulator [Balneolia bacterium]|nr:sigma 54-interacting transcriptional regulator [Balneolia bacterium]